jgi:hypothetical protein
MNHFAAIQNGAIAKYWVLSICNYLYKIRSNENFLQFHRFALIEWQGARVKVGSSSEPLQA